MSETVNLNPPGRLERWSMQLSRDKSDTLLLIAAISMVLGPHATHLPLWVTLLCATTLAWRALITFRGTRMPPSYVLLPLALGAMGGVYITFKTLLGREAGVAMAVMLLAFKMLEMHAKRDLFVVIFLSFFLLMTNFFYSQSIGIGVMMVLAIIALLTAQTTFQYTGSVPSLGRRLLLGAKIVGLAAPLALLIFFLFPRIQGPLWGMPGDATSGRTGLSSSMAPGNISNLAQSTDIAFRARFQGPVPRQEQLYWRGVVLDEFDGRTWSRSERGLISVSGAPRKLQGMPSNYQVTLEPHNEYWLLTLDLVGSVGNIEQLNLELTEKLELRSRARVTQRMRYDVRSHMDYRFDGGEKLIDSWRYRILPRGFNPLATQAGLDLQSEPDPAKRVSMVLEKFRKEPFSYTLQPPQLGRDSVDEFLYGTKAGFCEHYASAFVFLMRAAGVPARVVTGYQGGELNPIDNFMVIRQSDAHAWAEVWLGERGWVKVDPTAAVAPERVQRNLARALPPEPTFTNLINIQLSENSLLAKLRFRLSAINNGWNQWVLNYDAERRSNFLAGVSEAFGNWRTLLGIALACCLIVVVRVLHLRSEKDPVDTLYSALCQQIGRLGTVRAADEGPNAYAQRIAAMALAPEKKEAVLRFLQLYSAHKYSAQASDSTLAATLKRLLNKSQ